VTDIITAVQDPCRAFVISALEGYIPEAVIVWGNQDSPTPAEPCVVLFFTPTGTPARDAVEQIDADRAQLTGIREASIDLRIFAGPGSMALGYRLEASTNIEQKTEVAAAAGVVIYRNDIPKDVSYVRDGKQRSAASFAFGIRWNESEVFARDSIEQVTVTGTIKSDSGREYSVEVKN